MTPMYRCNESVVYVPEVVKEVKCTCCYDIENNRRPTLKIEDGRATCPNCGRIFIREDKH
ncbi:MAG: hypothetical protein A4E55_01838 [Pelotomaculum sp. PtaU1.Bin035]|nr:MAG: hypothetical protein A4E55_01838 [Pelotomaculum sp. PtaU1.Bin035]